MKETELIVGATYEAKSRDKYIYVGKSKEGLFLWLHIEDELEFISDAYEAIDNWLYNSLRNVISKTKSPKRVTRCDKLPFCATIIDFDKLESKEMMQNYAIWF